MYPDSAYAVPIGSFRVPVVVPDTDPDAAPLVTVCFNAAWLPYVLGCLKQLMLQATWQTTDPAVINLVQERAATLMYLFIKGCNLPESGAPGGGPDGEDGMWRQDPDNPCLLQFSADGQCWCTVFDASKCNPNPTQPSGGSNRPQPGQSFSDCYSLQANGVLNLPYPVYPGDTVEITSADGAGSDAPGLANWFCPNGTPYVFGQCEGFGGPLSGDPAPSVDHMRLIFNVGGSYSDGMGGAITIGGSGPQSVGIQVNDADISNNPGSYKVCVKVTNNQETTWSHTWDFTLTPGPWINVTPFGTPSIGVWTAGTGWVASGETTWGSGCWYGIVIAPGTISFSCDTFDLTYNFTGGQHDDPSQLQVSAGGVVANTTPNPDGSGQIWNAGAFTATSPSNWLYSTCAHHGGGIAPSPTGNIVFTSLTVTGHGVDPFA